MQPEVAVDTHVVLMMARDAGMVFGIMITVCLLISIELSLGD